MLGKWCGHASVSLRTVAFGASGLCSPTSKLKPMLGQNNVVVGHALDNGESSGALAKPEFVARQQFGELAWQCQHRPVPLHATCGAENP